MARPCRETPQCHVLVAMVSRYRGAAADAGLLRLVACLSSASGPPYHLHGSHSARPDSQPGAGYVVCHTMSSVSSSATVSAEGPKPPWRHCVGAGAKPLPLDNRRQDL